MTRRETALALGVSLAAAFLLLGDTVLSWGKVLPSLPLTDMTAHAVPTLTFLARSLSAGDLPLWNPHSFSGQPFLGAFEPGVLYPFNWLAAALGAAPTLALSCWLHLALGAFFMYAFCRRRGATRWASAAGGAAYALSGPSFLLLAPGHVGPFAVVAWAPAFLLSLEAWLETRRVRWVLAAAAASALQWLAGYPQMAYLSALFCGGAALFACWGAPKGRMGYSGVGYALLGGFALAAVQLLPGLEAARESVRNAGLSVAEAGRFAMPPENLLTALSPFALGGLGDVPYFGRGYLWEHCVFFGRSALALAAVGLWTDRASRRYAAAAGLALLVSLGPLTPLFTLLHGLVPGFKFVRGSAKALFLVPLFLAPLAARGFDAARNAEGSKRLGWISGVLAAVAAGLTILLAARPDLVARGLWALAESGAAELPLEVYRSPSFAEAAGTSAARQLGAAAGLLAALCAAAFGASASARPVLLAAALAAELSFFGWSSRAFSSSEPRYPGDWLAASATLPSGERVLHDPFAFPNAALLTGARDVWGYAALVPRRYAELIAGTQGLPASSARNLFPITREHRALDLASLRLVFDPKDGHKIARRKGDLPPARLFSRWERVPEGGALARVLAPGFKPDAAVFVEGGPAGPGPGGKVKGAASAARRGADEIVVEAAADRDAVVLLSETYSSGWRARDGAGRPVALFPADHAFLGFAVPPGPTRVILEFSPSSYRLGLLVSALSLLLWITLWIAKPR